MIEFEKLRARVMNVHPGVLETNMSRKATEAGLVVPCDDGELVFRFFLPSLNLFIWVEIN